jgi:hypothetical protein
MKKLIYLSVLTILLGSFLTTNFVQASERNGAGFIKNSPVLKIKSTLAPVATSTGKEAQTQNRINVAQKRANTIRLYFNNMVRKIQAAINRESKLADRIESRLNKFEAAGKDVSALKIKLADARVTIKDAQKYLDDAKAQMETVLKSDNVKQAFQDVKTLIKNATEKVKLTHQKLIDIVNSMKGMSETACKTVSDCGKPLVCKDGKEYPAWACNDGKCSQIEYFRDPCMPLPSGSALPSLKSEILMGNLIKNSESAPSLEKGYWYLVYETPGAPALSAKLIFNNSSICGENVKCVDNLLNIGDRVKVSGIMSNKGFLVKTLEWIK